MIYHYLLIHCKCTIFKYLLILYLDYNNVKNAKKLDSNRVVHHESKNHTNDSYDIIASIAVFYSY